MGQAGGTAFPCAQPALHRCICHPFKSGPKPKPVRKVNSLNCAVNSIHQPEGKTYLIFFFLFFFLFSFLIHHPSFPLFSDVEQPKSLYFLSLFLPSPPPKSLDDVAARIEKKRRELNPSCAKHIYIYRREKLWGSMKAIGTVQQSPFDLALLSVISDGQTGGWGPCAPRSTAQHSNRLYSLLRYHPLRSLSYRETSRERERKASSSSLGYKPATNSTGYSGMFSNLSEILLFLVDQNHTRLAIDLWRGPLRYSILYNVHIFFHHQKRQKRKDFPVWPGMMMNMFCMLVCVCAQLISSVSTA